MKTALNGRVMQCPDEDFCEVVTGWFRSWPAQAEGFDGTPFFVDDVFVYGDTWTFWVSQGAILALWGASAPKRFAPERPLTPEEQRYARTATNLIQRVASSFNVHQKSSQPELASKVALSLKTEFFTGIIGISLAFLGRERSPRSSSA